MGPPFWCSWRWLHLAGRIAEGSEVGRFGVYFGSEMLLMGYWGKSRKGKS